ncbi:MAG: hypothetical protein ACUZ8E_01960, partial [Candidatus Anammoxibacter sp.]
ILGITPVEVTVTALDQDGNPMANVEIDAKLAFGFFSIFASVEPKKNTTDANGKAVFQVKQGFFANPDNSVTFSSGSVSTTVTRKKGFFGFGN